MKFNFGSCWIVVVKLRIKPQICIWFTEFVKLRNF